MTANTRLRHPRLGGGGGILLATARSWGSSIRFWTELPLMCGTWDGRGIGSIAGQQAAGVERSALLARSALCSGAGSERSGMAIFRWCQSPCVKGPSSWAVSRQVRRAAMIRVTRATTIYHGSEAASRRATRGQRVMMLVRLFLDGSLSLEFMMRWSP